MPRRSLSNQAVPLVTSLPSTPVDGEEVIYQTAAMKAMDAGPWLLRYDVSTADAYKWWAIGSASAPLESESTVNHGGVAAEISLGPLITLPLAGVWYIEVFANQCGADTTSAYGRLGYKIGAAANMDPNDAITTRAYGTQNDFKSQLFRRRKTITTAGTVIQSRANCSSGLFYPTGNGTNPFGLRAWPVRIG